MLRDVDRAAPLAVLVLLAVTSGASAQEVLVDLTLDGPPDPAYNYVYDYSGGGEPQTDHSSLSSATSSITANGRNGSNAFTISGDFSAVPLMPQYNYYGIGGGLGVFRYDFETNTTHGLPSGDLAEYTFSADLAGAGYTLTESAFMEVQLLVPDDRITPDADTNFDPFATVRYDLSGGVGLNMENYTFRLDEGVLAFNEARVPAEDRDFPAHAADIGLLNLQFQLQSNFGSDSDNQFFIDNVRLTVIPEPASGLLLAAGLGLGMSRPRRSRQV